MKNRMIVFCVALLLTWGAFFWITANNKETGDAVDSAIEPHVVTKVNILKPVIDVGKVCSDTVVKATYHVVNVGKDSLFVAYVNPDCMCTKYECSCNKVAGGDTLCVRLYVNTKNKIGKQKLMTILKLNTKDRMHKLTMMMDVTE